ncbi:MAG: DsbC family protein [Pseudomonadales bacterium]
MVKFGIAAVCAALLSLNLNAASVEENIAAKIKEINENVVVDSVVASPWAGMYEVTLGTGETLFSDERSEYLVVGQMFNLVPGEGLVNLTALKNQKKVVAKLDELSDEEKIVYPAEGEERAVVHVFTDISCYYCQKLHKNIPELQANGVTVKYLAFPRAGEGSEVAKQMQSVWCASDQKAAMSRAKAKQRVEESLCSDVVAEQYVLGQQLGVQATPTVFAPDGRLMAGFASVERLLFDLNLL